MTDSFAEIQQERAGAQAALADAERRMLAGSRDPKAFAKAKSELDAAAAELERLEWAEKAERERQEQQAARAKTDRLREVQANAAAAHERARALAADVAATAERLVEVAKALQAEQQTVGVGVHHETFALRDGTIKRATVEARVAVDKVAAVRALRAAKELCKLAGMHPQAADQQAEQQRL